MNYGAVFPELLDVTPFPDPAYECQVAVMNYGAMRIYSKGHFQGGIQVKNEKNSQKSKCKPLWGKVFYIDLPSVTVSEKLPKDIKDLGRRVEEFLSKDISYLISNKTDKFLVYQALNLCIVQKPLHLILAMMEVHLSLQIQCV
eukprot:bmy_07755T0